MNFTASKEPLRIAPTLFNDSRGGVHKVLELEEPMDMGQFLFNKTISAQTFRGLHCQMNEYSEEKVINCQQGVLIWFCVALSKIGGVEFKTFEFKLLPGESIFVPKGFLNGMLSLTDNVELAIVASRRLNHQCSLNVSPFGEIFFQNQVEKYDLKNSYFRPNAGIISQEEFCMRLSDNED